MSLPILSLVIDREQDTVSARQRARQIARLLGFDAQDQTRISTAVSEIARNAFNYAGGGRVEYVLEGRTAPQLFIVKISDTGPGIRDLNCILEGRYTSETGMGLGIVGARRLMDHFQIDSTPGRGTTIHLKKLLPKRAGIVRAEHLSQIVAELMAERPQDPLHELQHQNQELLGALEEIRARQTELTRVNRELEDTNRGVIALYAELDEKADHLRRADELKSRFLSNMSHEFRSPLNSILALSGLLLGRADGDLNSEQIQQVGYVRRAAEDLLELVNDLLDLAKVEAGKVEVKPIEFAAAHLFAALRGMLRPLLANQSVDLVFEDVSGLSPLISDEAKVSQILRNFISNALKFTERGEIRVSAAAVGEREIVFSVSDTGIGIAPENLDLIFQDFSQVDHPIQRRVKGTGLGLPLSKKLATVLGGKVSVESRPGLGSRFMLQIPRHYADATPEVIPAPQIVRDPASLPILVIEDSPEIVAAYKSYLKGSGFQMLPATTSHAAEDILDQIKPSAIVLDIVLRAEDSWRFLTKLKQNDDTRNIPVVVVSSIEDQAKGFHLGVERYLIKPVGGAELIRNLRDVTGQRPLDEALIIDDEERARYVLKQKLRDLPLLVMEASSGSEGIRSACKNKPSIIFLDLGMPDLTGFQVLETLKNEPSVADTPVVIVTSRALTGSERALLSQRASAIVDKANLEHTDFVAMIRHATRENGAPLNAA
jgi:signal transduction histidine kinase/CheY-like chemotaxis protein